MANEIQSRKNNARDITKSYFKSFHRPIVIKPARYQYKNSPIGQWDTIEKPDINKHTCKQLIFDNEARNKHQMQNHCQQMVLIEMDGCTQKN